MISTWNTGDIVIGHFFPQRDWVWSRFPPVPLFYLGVEMCAVLWAACCMTPQQWSRTIDKFFREEKPPYLQVWYICDLDARKAICETVSSNAVRLIGLRIYWSIWIKERSSRGMGKVVARWWIPYQHASSSDFPSHGKGQTPVATFLDCLSRFSSEDSPMFARKRWGPGRSLRKRRQTGGENGRKCTWK